MPVILYFLFERNCLVFCFLDILDCPEIGNLRSIRCYYNNYYCSKKFM